VYKIKNFLDSSDCAFILLCVICTILVFSSFKYLEFYGGADESYYLRYATLANEDGLTAFQGMFKDYISDSQNWVFPNPLRIAFITISALWTRIFGATYLALSSLSLFCYLLALAVSYYFSKKYFGRTVSLLFCILLAFSPLNMAMARRALVDSAANLFLISSIWLFFDMLEDRKRFKYFIFVITYALAILIKETAILLVPVFVLYLFIRRYALKKELHLSDLLYISIYPPLLAGIVYLAAAGTPFNVLRVIKIIMASPSTNLYAILYSSGPWFRYVVDFILLSPWVSILAIGFFFSYISSKQYQEKMLYFMSVFIIYFLVLNIFAKNIRYAILLDTPLRIFAVFMILKIIENRFTKSKYAPILPYTLVIAIAAYDYLSFYNLFITNGIYDPVSFLLLKARQFIPIM
jgi:4-amino-4-deoxy-L-arabinose transferase-like glycosyltransferase